MHEGLVPSVLRAREGAVVIIEGMDDLVDVETIGQRGNTLLLRARTAGGEPVLVKTHGAAEPTEAVRDRLRREYVSTTAVEHPNLIRARELIDGPTRVALVCDDPGPTTLADPATASGLTMVDLVTIGIEVANGLAALHAKGLVHRAVDAHHIVMAGHGAVLADLYDAWPAGTRPRRGSHGHHPAPEQEGSAPRPADPASDQLALAVTLKEVATVAGLVVPAGLGSVLDQAAATDPRQRYRSVVGFINDLRWARDLVAAGDPCEPFPLSRSAPGLTWTDPDQMVGRGEVLVQLDGLVTEVARDRVGQVVVLRGAPGSGRSTVARAFCDRLADQGILSGFGELDDAGSILPFRAGIEIMAQFVDQILAAPEATLTTVRAEVIDRLAHDLPYAVRLMPSLVRLVGEQPEPVNVSLGERVVRVVRTLRTVVGAIAESFVPLVAVFDDADPPGPTSLRALEALAGHPEAGPHLLVLVSDTENTVLDDALARMQARGVRVHELRLPSLDRSAARQLVADGTGAPVEEIAPVADAVWRRSGGSPARALDVVRAMLADGELWVDVASGRWRWSSAALRSVDHELCPQLVARRVAALDADVRQALTATALAGRAATTSMISAWLGVDSAGAEDLVDRGVVARVLAWRGDAGRVVCLDDEVRRVALSLAEAQDRQALELGVAHALLAATASTSEDVSLTDVGAVEVLEAEVVRLMGGVILDDPVDRDRYVWLCEHVAEVAGLSAAYAEALDLLLAAIETVGVSGWTDDRERSFRLHLHATEHALVLRRESVAGDLLTTIRAQRPTALENVRALQTLGRDTWLGADPERALAELRRILAELGERIPERSTRSDVGREWVTVRRALGTKEPEWFLDAPRVAREDVAAALEALLAASDLARDTHPRLHACLVLRGCRLTAEQGLSPPSGYFLTWFGVLSSSSGGSTDRGLRFARVGAELGERAGREVATLTRFAYHGFAVHWGAALDETIEPLREAYAGSVALNTRDRGLDSGTLALLHGVLASRPLITLRSEADTTSDELAQVGATALATRVDVVRQAIDDLRAGSAGASLEGNAFSSRRWLQGARARGELALEVHTMRALVALCHGALPAAAEDVEAARPLVSSAPGHVAVALHRFQRALLDAQNVTAGRGLADRLRRRARAERSLQRLRRLASDCPANAAHRVALVEAILLGGDRRSRIASARAMERYDDAVRLATAAEAWCDLGLIAEGAARLHVDRGRDALARHYASVARDAWTRWGADGVAATMSGRLPGLAAGEPTPRAPLPTSVDRVRDDDALAAATAAAADRSAQTFAEAGRLLGQELEVREFLERMVEILMRHAGATRGFLVLHSQWGPVVEVAGRADGDVVRVGPLASPDPADHPDLCLPAANYVLRTRQALVLTDPAADRRFRGDPELRERAPRVLIGLPIGRPSGTSGTFVFESESSAATESARVEALRVLSAQAASALDHARLTSDLSTLSRDVAHLRSTADSLTARAEADPLTGVANRLGLEARVRNAIARLEFNDSPGFDATEVGVLFCDVDDFKSVNDTFGHAAGDAALVQIAARLRETVRSDDIVARLGGDEFVVVSIGVEDEELMAMAHRALASAALPVDIGVGHPVTVHLSIGVGRGRLPSTATVADIESLVETADEAMYRAKRAGKNRIDRT